MNYQKFIRGILPFYVAIGPVYWFIAISPNLFNLVKYIIAIIVIISPLIFTTHTYYLKPGIIKQSGVVLIIGIIILSMPSVLVNQSSEGVVIISRYFILLGLLLGFYWTLTYRHVYDKLPLVMSLVLSFLCLITIYDWLFGGNLYSFDHQMRLYKVGFSTTRTGWSSGLGCCAVFLMWQFLISINKQRYLYLFAFVCIVFSQLASGGRGGLLASLVGALGLCIYYRKFHYLLILALFGSLFALNNQEMLTHHLRIDRLSAGSNADFSSGRFSHYTHALEVVNSIGDILFGLGPKGYKDYFIELAISNEIHNVWIRLLEMASSKK